MKQREIVVGIDIGTSNIRVIVGDSRSDFSINIIGVGLSASEGIKKGIIVDLDKTVDSITRAVEEAERMSGIKIDTAFISLVGLGIELINNKGVVAVSSEDREISQQDVERVLNASRVIALPFDREIIDVIPREYIVDGYSGIRDPAGMLGVRLEVDALVLTGSITTLRNLVRCVNRAGLTVEGVVLQSMANAEIALSRDEKELGVFLVDMGGGITEIALFQHGNLQSLEVVSIGGDHITNDLAVGLRTGFRDAENLKLEYGWALSAMADPEEKIEIMGVGGKEKRKVSEKELGQFIEPRVQEILQLCRDKMTAMGWREMPPAGVVLTGGVSLMDGLTEAAESAFGVPVRVAEPHFVGVQNPIYTTAVGVIHSMLHKNTGGMSDKKVKKRKQGPGLWTKIRAWFSDFFE